MRVIAKILQHIEFFSFFRFAYKYGLEILYEIHTLFIQIFIKKTENDESSPVCEQNGGVEGI